MKEFVNGRKKIPEISLSKKGKRIWFHCASLGEFEQARPVMEAIKIKDAGISIVLTFFSPSGYQQKHNYNLADVVLYLPLDTPSGAARLLKYLQPDMAVFVKYEIWYFHLKALFHANIPVYLISAVFREKQFIFSFFGRWLYNLLPGYRMIFVQDKGTYKLLEKNGLKNIELSGDTRYDRVKQAALFSHPDERIEKFKNGKFLLIAGSSWQQEENLIRIHLSSSDDTEKVIIAPHDVSQENVREILEKFSEFNPVLYTDQQADLNAKLMILDTIGHLANAYLYADMAFIGGAFGRGLHNILEPLAFGVPVIIGPEYRRYPEALQAIESGVAISVGSLEEYAKAFAFLMDLLKTDGQLKLRCTDFIGSRSGASEHVLKKLLS